MNLFSRNASGIDSGAAGARVDAVDGAQYVKPAMRTGGNTSTNTNATGGNWAAFGDIPCTQLTFINDTLVDIEFRQDAAGVALPVFDGSVFTIYGITNANQITVRRKDQSNTQVLVKARWEA